MNTIKTFIFTLTLTVFGGQFIQAQHTDMRTQTFTNTQQDVLAAVEKMTAAFHNKDIEGVMASYEPEAVVVFEPETPVSDPAILREMFQGMFMVNPVFEYSGHEVFVNGNTAMHISPWSMTGTAPDGEAVAQSGLSIAVLRQQDNGDWLMIFDNPHGQFLMGPQ